MSDVRRFRFYFDRVRLELLLDVDDNATLDWFRVNSESFLDALHEAQRTHLAANEKWTGDRRGFEAAKGALLAELAKVFPDETFKVRYTPSPNESVAEEKS